MKHKDQTGEGAVHQSAYVQSSDPGAVGAYKDWYDTTTDPAVHKVRNSGDTGWLTVGAAGSSSLPVADTTALVKDPSDATKLVRIDAGTVATGTTRVITMPNADVDLVDIANHIADTTDAHDASAISYAGGTGMSSTDIEAAVDELATEKANASDLTAHTGDTSDAHDASAISFAPAGTIAATDVQAAIEEVATEAAAGNRTLVTLGSDVTNSTTSHADVTGLSFSVVSGTIYRFEALIIWETAVTTTGSRWSISGPASPTMLAYTAQWISTSSSNITLNSGTYDQGTASTSTPATTGNWAFIRGIIQPSANGTVIMRFASEVAASTVTAKAGSALEWW